MQGSTTQAQHQIERGLLLNVVVGKGASVFQLFACKNETLLIWRNSFFILDFRFYVIDRVGGLYIQSDSFACECLHEDLHASTQAQHQMERGLLLNVVVGKGASPM